MTPRLLVYSDCPVLGGADILALDLLKASDGPFETRFVYRASERFESALRARGGSPAPARAVSFPDRVEIVERRGSGPAAKAALRLLDAGLLPYEIGLLRRVFAAQAADVVHVNNGGYPGALGCRAAAVAARLAGARAVVMAVHNQTRPLTLPNDLLDVGLDPLVRACVDRFVVASETARRSLAARGVDPRRVAVIPDGVADATAAAPKPGLRRELGLADDELVFVTTAFFEPRKGHRVLVEAAARLRGRGAVLPRFVLIGDGPERPAIERAARERGVADRFVFTGYRPDAAAILAAADAFVLPSTGNEDMPLAILDAMALSKPVVATRLAGIPEEVDHERTGLLAAPGDADELGRALDRVATDAALRRRFGEAGRARFLERFETSRMCARYQALYRELLSA